MNGNSLGLRQSMPPKSQFLFFLTLSVLLILPSPLCAAVASGTSNYTFTAEERVKLEEKWKQLLINHANKLSAGFDKAMPDDYLQFGQFRAKEWGPAFGRDRDSATQLFPKLTQRNTVDFIKIRQLHNAFVRLEIMANAMLTYLKSQKRADLEKVRTHMMDFHQLINS